MDKIVFDKVTVNKIIPGENGESRSIAILRDISFSVGAESVFIVMGPSGSGKSTLLRLINRLEDPSSGRILLDGEPIDKMPVQTLRRKVGLIQQLPHIFEGSLMDNILYGPLLRGESRGPLEEKARQMLEHLGFDRSILDKSPERLSVGEKQRICILRSLMNGPEVLLMDEPTSALDEKNVHRLLSLIERINREDKTTIIMVTHAFSHGLGIGHQALGIASGGILAQGDVNYVVDTLRRKGISEDEELDNLDLTDEGIADA